MNRAELELFAGTCAATAAVLVPLYHFILWRHPEVATVPRRNAWVLTIFSSVVCGPLSLWHVWRYIYHWDQHAMFSDDSFCRALCTFFFAYLAVDTIYAKLHYASEMTWLEGWGHHLGYMGLFFWALSGHFTIGLVTTMPLELSTIPLSIGRVFPNRRRDLLFGGLFFLTRVVYHGFLLFRWYSMEDPPLTLWPICAVVLVLHVHWWIKWAQGMIRRSRKARVESDKPKGS